MLIPLITSILGAAKNNQNAQQTANLTSAVHNVMNSANKAKTMTSLEGMK